MQVSKKYTQFSKRLLQQYVTVFLIIAVFIVGVIVGRNNDKVVIEPANGGIVTGKDQIPDFLDKDLDFSIFWDEWNILKQEYVDQPVNETRLLYGALAGMAASLGDPHTVFFDPDTTNEFNSELSGSFEGIGAEIAIKHNQLTIVSPLAGSPAETAGIRSGDVVLAIDGQDTRGMSLEYAVSIIRGPKGSTVTITITRDGFDEAEDIVITRDTIEIKSVNIEFENAVAILTISAFHEDTEKLLDKAIVEILKKNPKGIILDLRNNPGGFLDTAINTASEWIEDGVVVSERASNGTVTPHYARGKARLKDFKTIVLINGGSASGSEIVAGALKDYGLGTLVGETTFGKGSVQTLIPLDDGSSLKITVAKWVTPYDNEIDSQGIDPDIKIELTEEDFSNDFDPQMDKALELFQ